MNNVSKGSLLGMAMMIALASGYVSTASAGSACVSHIAASIMGQEIDHRDCIQNVSQPEDMFREGCQEAAAISNMLAAEEMPDVTIHRQSTEYVAGGCPANPQGSCKGVSDGQLNFLYWDRSTAQLAEMQQACRTIGGVWQEG